MAGAVRTKAYQDLLKYLVDCRQNAGLSQADLAVKLGKPASFVGKYELGERRLDVVELIVVLRSLDAPIVDAINVVDAEAPRTL